MLKFKTKVNIRADSLPAEPQGKPKNTGVGSLSFLQWIFPTQEPNRGLPHCRQILYQLSNAGDLGSIPGLGKSPGEGKGYPLQYFGLENYSPGSCKESDTTERLSFSLEPRERRVTKNTQTPSL